MKSSLKAAVLAATLAPVAAHAFKIDTHVWVGQQVINDLADDGKISLQLGNKLHTFDVPAGVRDAILNNQEAYLMGNIGPDAAPDVVAGQSVAHPGLGEADEAIPVGWMTADWMMHLLQAAESATGAGAGEVSKAYTYGYIGHAAADVFAHTYVNMYAGGVFDLEDESLVEQRHFMLENFIGRHTPELVDHQGNPLGEPWERVAMNDGLATFIRDSLVYHPQAQAQYRMSEYAQHLVAYKEFRDTIESMAEDGSHEDVNIAVTRIVAWFYGVDLSQEDAESIVQAGEKLADFLSGEVVEGIQKGDNEIYRAALRFEEQGFSEIKQQREALFAAEEKYFDRSQRLVEKMAALKSELGRKKCGVAGEILDDVKEFHKDVYDVVSFDGALDPGGLHEKVIDNIGKNPIDRISSLFGGGGGGSGGSMSYTGDWEGFLEYMRAELTNLSKAAWGSVDVEEHMAVYESYEPIEGTFTLTRQNGVSTLDASDSGFEKFCEKHVDVFDKVSNTMLDDVDTLKEQLREDKKEFLSVANSLRDEMLTILESHKNLENALIDLGQIVTSDVNPVQALLRNWVKDIDLAMVEYIKAANQSIVNTMNPEAEVLDPMQQWFECYHLSLIGAPNVVSGCDFKGSFTAIKDSFDAIKNALGQGVVAGPVPGPEEIDAFIKDLQEKAVEKLKEKVAEELVDLLPENVQDIIELLHTPPTDTALNAVFTKPETVSPALGLQMLSDAADRVRYDMKATCESFDPMRFPATYNSVVLAKLALLDNATFEAMAQSLGSTSYSQWGELGNVVAIAFANIDGNHAWLSVAPPLPNSKNEYPKKNITYSTNRTLIGGLDEVGLAIWREDLRWKLFTKAFIGPMAPALPKTSGYPYRECVSNPFPYRLEDAACGADASAYNLTTAEIRTALGRAINCPDPEVPAPVPAPVPTTPVVVNPVEVNPMCGQQVNGYCEDGIGEVQGRAEDSAEKSCWSCGGFRRDRYTSNTGNSNCFKLICN